MTSILIISIAFLTVIISVGILVFRDAKRKGMPQSSALTWAIASAITFPVGTLLYFLLAKPTAQPKVEAQAAGDITNAKPVDSKTRTFAQRHGGLIAIFVYLLFIAGTNLYSQGYFCFSFAREVDPLSVQWQKGIGACFDGEFLWVANNNEESVLKVDPDSQAVVSSVNIGGRAWGMAFDGKSLWVSVRTGDFPMSGHLAKINLKTLTVKVYDNFIVNPTDYADLYFDGKFIWGGMDGVSKVCGLNGIVITDNIIRSGPAFLTSDGKNVWAASQKFYKINPANGEIIESIGLVPGDVGGTLLFDGEDIWHYIGRNLYWLDLDEAGDPLGVTRYSVDVYGGTAVTDGSHIWMIDIQDGSVAEFDIQKKQTTKITNIGFVDAGAMEATLVYDGSDIWVVNRNNGGFVKLIR